MMLRYSFGLTAEAPIIEEVIKETISYGNVTKDLAKNSTETISTIDFGKTVNTYINKITQAL